MGKLAIFGGTFNPIHWGHLLVAETALNQVGLDRVIWLPSYDSPYKSSVELADFSQRLELIRRSIADHPRFTVEDRSSAEKQDPPLSSYAIDRLTMLQSRYPHNQWCWIIGLDAFRSLPRWYRWREVVEQCEWLIAPRQGGRSEIETVTEKVEKLINNEGLPARPIRWQILKMPQVDISSSLVRQHCRDRQSIRYLVPEAARLYILEKGLYQSKTS
jgi:nicotinate-nucleotide adenylyltransferase